MARGSVTRTVSTKTGKARWRARVSFADDTETRRHRSKSFRTRKEAEAWLTRTDHELRTGAYIEPSTMPLATFAEDWLRRAESRLRGSTVYRYRQDWRLYIKPALGATPISRIRATQVQNLYDALTARGLAPFTVTGVHRVLNGMMKAALADELIRTNPCAGRTLPKPRRENVAFWTSEQLRAFLEHTADKPTGPLWTFLAYTGARLGEALALRWADVDLEQRTAWIHRTVRKDRHGRITVGEGAKTRASNRTISLPAMAIMALQRQRARIEQMEGRYPRLWEDHDLVFPNAYGGVKPPGNVQVTFAGYVTAAGVPVISPHGLRHTAASMLFRLGVHPKIVQEQLGHTSIAMTMDLYSHMSESMRRSAADALDTLLDDAGDTTTSDPKKA